MSLSSSLLLVLPNDGEDAFAISAGPDGEQQGDSEPGFDAIDDSALEADNQSPPSSITRVAGETGVSSDADTAGLALATEAALVAVDPALAASALAMSLTDELSQAEAAMAALSPTTPTTAPPTTAAPTTVSSSTTAAPTTTAIELDSFDAETTTLDADGSSSETTSPDTASTETTATETTVPMSETTVSETSVSETTVAETTVPETTVPETTAADGWVDTGNGVLVPQVLLEIRWCESRDDYTAANPSSSARGGYQFLTGSWDAYGHKDRYGVSQAHLATPAQQDEAALITWERDGTRPWNASKSCWSARI